MRGKGLTVSIALGLGLTLTVLWLLSAPSAGLPVARAAGEITVCPDGTCDYTTIQAAVDAASEGDVIKVATFSYHGVIARPRNDVVSTGVVSQVVYISKTVTIRGGYTKHFNAPPDPVANPTTVDPEGQGRGIYITGGISPVIEGLRITGGDARGLGGYHPSFDWSVGGGVYIISATATMSNCQVFGNTVNDPPYGGKGGGLYLHMSDAILKGNTIFSNTLGMNGQGGGLYLSGGAPTVSDNAINGNAGATDGGGLYVSGGTPTLSGNSITGNRASRSGGGLGLYISEATLEGNTISDNTAGVSGGGLRVTWSDNATLNSNTVISNTASAGGGIYLYDSDATVRGNIVFSNTATGTHWRHGGGGLFLEESAATVSGNTVRDNAADNHGGGAYLYDSAGAVLSGNTIGSNMTDTSGGGVFAFYGEDVKIEGNYVVSNEADSGGGVFLEYCDATLTNNIVAGNEAHTAGSGLYVRRSSPNLLFNTIAHNSGGDGIGTYVATSTVWPYYSTLDLVNTIFASHTVGITVTEGSTATLKATFWHGNGTRDGGPGTVIRSNDYDGDPSFVNPGAGDFHIRADSDARDKGVNVFVYTDIDGQLRPEGGGYDIGADEYYLVLKFTYLPVMLRNH